jgi:hypothetical protein
MLSTPNKRVEDKRRRRRKKKDTRQKKKKRFLEYLIELYLLVKGGVSGARKCRRFLAVKKE